MANMEVCVAKAGICEEKEREERRGRKKEGRKKERRGGREGSGWKH